MEGTVRTGLSQLKERLAYLLRSRGSWGTLQRAFAQVLSPLLNVTDFYITMQYWRSASDVNEKWPDDGDLGTHSVVVESVEEFEEFRDEFDDYFDFEKSRNFLARSPKRLIVLARRPRKDGGCQVIGMRTCEIGIFSIWNRKRRIELPNDIVMIYNNEVHPQYRGQRVTLISRKGFYEYGMKNGVIRTIGITGSHNLSSLKAHMKGSGMIRPTIKGKIRRVTLLGGLIDWMTPADEIKAMIEAAPVDFEIPNPLKTSDIPAEKPQAEGSATSDCDSPVNERS